MKRYPPVPGPKIRVPAFVPVPARTRTDGWTSLRQAQFLGHLAATRSVSAAARAVGMAREGAYRLRDRPDAGSFAAAWDRVMGRPERKVTAPTLPERLARGLVRPVMRGGRVVAIVQKTDPAARRALVGRIERMAAAAEPLRPKVTAQKPHDLCKSPCPLPGKPAT